MADIWFPRAAYRRRGTNSLWGQLCHKLHENERNWTERGAAIDLSKISDWPDVDLISLHIRSMWETICDAKASRKCEGKFVIKILRTHYSGIRFRTPPPLPENWNLDRTWHFGFWYSRTQPPPPPKKIKIWADLGTLGFDFPGHPPPTPHTLQWQLEYVETNCCIPQGYHLVCYVSALWVWISINSYSSVRPSCRQNTWASFVSQPSPQILPHSPLWRTSALPLNWKELEWGLTLAIRTFVKSTVTETRNDKF